jgi:anhydro-N-acetylmuramic acid kinase
MEPIWSLGLMSGTSLDGVDAAWLRTDGAMIMEIGGGFTAPYPSILREKIRNALGQRERTPDIQALEREVTLFQAQIVGLAQERHHFDLVGFHGQTIFHVPPQTLQLGDGNLLAREVGIDVIFDFRSQDVAQGGEGAPLVPVFHQAIVPRDEISVIVNVGGVANITWVHKNGMLIACDTGPGGALLDDWVLQTIGQPYDEHGQLSAQGAVAEEILQRWLSHSYFSKLPPKSLDRDAFFQLLSELQGVSPADGAATLGEFTARTIVLGLAQMPAKPDMLYVAGGGRRNLHLLHRLRALAPCPVETIEALGWDGDLLEAHAFAYLAARVKAGLPISFPTTTGVQEPVCGGRLARAV